MTTPISVIRSSLFLGTKDTIDIKDTKEIDDIGREIYKITEETIGLDDFDTYHLVDDKVESRLRFLIPTIMKKFHWQQRLMKLQQSLMLEYREAYYSFIFNEKISRLDIIQKEKFNICAYLRNIFTSQKLWAPYQRLLLIQMLNMSLFDRTIISVGCGNAHNEMAMLLLMEKINAKGRIMMCDIDEYVDESLKGIIVQKSGELFIDEFKDEKNSILYISWPVMDLWVFETLCKFTGEYVIYVGEYRYGCCATDEFFNELDKNWHLVWSDYEPYNWDSIHCYPSIYRRRSLVEDKKRNKNRKAHNRAKLRSKINAYLKSKPV